MLRFERLLTAVVPRLKKWQATTVLPRNSTVKLSTNVGAARRQKYGQPHPSTHKHLLKAGEVNVGVTRAEFVRRRENLAQAILAQADGKKGNLVVLPSARKKYMVDHIPYFFRQDTDFRYLTGCLQPESLLVLDVREDATRSFLFLKENTSYEEKWEGARFGFREAVEFFGVDEAYSGSNLQEFLYRYSCDNKKFNLWYDLNAPRDEEVNKTVQSFISSIDRANFNTIIPVRDLCHELRSVKSTSEIKLMRKTCEIGAKALSHAMAASKDLNTENQFLATVDHQSRMLGANFLAYPPVVGTGNNANTIHYIAATDCVNPGDLILIDAGCEYHGYTSDITRTWPVKGKFSDAQTIVYQLVLQCQQTLIRSIRPGETSISCLYKQMQSLLANSLRSAGIISQSLDEATAARYVHLFCPHNVGHHLGMDVHDCASVSKTRALVPGNVITVEPGVYINKHDSSVPEEFRGIGIRIEDDVLINQSGCEVLSSDCPTSLQEIQAIVTGSVDNCSTNSENR